MELRNTTLDDLSAVIGFSATLRLAAWFGDRGNLYIPDRVEEGQLLVKLIGMSAAKKLTEEWGHQHISVPRLRAYEDDERKRTIGWLLEHGASTKQIGREMRMSERRVQQIQRELEAAGLIEIVVAKNAGKNAPGKTPGKNRGDSSKENAPQELPRSFFGKQEA
jgi:hypothetical protein